MTKFEPIESRVESADNIIDGPDDRRGLGQESARVLLEESARTVPPTEQSRSQGNAAHVGDEGAWDRSRASSPGSRARTAGNGHAGDGC